MSLTAFAASGTVIGPYTITGGMRNIDYKLEDDVLYILSDIPLTIANTDIDTASTVPIVVNADVDGNIILAGVNIAPSAAAAIDVSPATQSEANVTITIADDTVNTLQGGTDYAGLQKNGDYISENEGKLVIQGATSGTGKLDATGGNGGAGIGSGAALSGVNSGAAGTSSKRLNSSYGYGGDGGNGGDGDAGTNSVASNIVILSGIIVATGGNCAAGIGSGCGGAGVCGGNGGDGEQGGNGGANSGNGGDGGAGGNGGASVASHIIIEGGAITAKGGLQGGAGIGSGLGGQGASGGNGGAGGINGKSSNGRGGSGGQGGNGGKSVADNIIINGGNVVAISSDLTSDGFDTFGAGIGSGLGGSGGQGGNAGMGGGGTAGYPSGGTGGTGGTGGESCAANIVINDGTVTSTGSKWASGIGSGKGGTGGTGGCVTTLEHNKYNGGYIGEAGLGGDSIVQSVIIHGRDVIAYGSGFAGGTAIGSGVGGTGGTGGTQLAVSGFDGIDGLKGGTGGTGGNSKVLRIVIDDGNIVATNVLPSDAVGCPSAGIGSGTGGNGGAGGKGGKGMKESSEDRSGGKGGTGGTGGTGGNSVVESITIMSGTVTATGIAGGAGVGSSLGGSGGSGGLAGAGADSYGSYDNAGGNGATGSNGITGTNTVLGIRAMNCSLKALGSANGSYYGANIGSSATSTADGTPYLPMDADGNNLYLAEIENSTGGPIVIDGDDYPTKHFEEAQIYAYLTGSFHTITTDEGSYAVNPRTGQTLPLPDVTAPTPVSNLVYNENLQTLIEAGETSNGTMMYALDKTGPWLTDLPTATNADTYTVWYKSEGDNVTVASTNPESIEVTIARAPWVFSQDQLDNISATSLIYEQTLGDSVLSGSLSYDGAYEWKTPTTVPTVADSNRTGFTVVFTPMDTNYDVAETTCTLTVNKKSFTFTQSDINSMAASDLTYGQTLSESSITGTTPVDGSFRFVDGVTMPIVNGTNNFAVEFVPNDISNYEISSVGDVHVTVNQADPIITAEQLAAMTVSEITYGQTLADSTITATSTTPGTFAWSNNTIAPTVANSLNTEYEILFTPTDTDNYKTRTIYKTVKVNKAPIILSETIKQSVTATAINYEQTLADSVLSGDVPQAGHYEWVDNTIAPSVADSNVTAYDVVFVPDDENYANAELTCTLSVSKKAFTFTQTDIDNLSASDLTYGQMLSQSIISGDKPVAGSYRFVDGAAVPTVLGANNFAVEFVPADTDNYEVSSVGDIHVTVNKAEPIVTTEQINAMTVSEITYGQTLADSTITAISTTPGLFEWNDDGIAPTVADSLTTEYNILFTPNDTDNYTTKLIAKTVKVNKATPTVPEDIATSISATEIKFGKTLNDSTLSYIGSGTLTGSLSWTNPETQPAIADSDTTEYAVTYTPVDNVNYKMLQFAVKVHVDKGEAPAALQDFETTVSTGAGEGSGGTGTANADGSITLDLSTILDLPGISGVVSGVVDPDGLFDGMPTITDGTKLTYKINPIGPDVTGTIKVIISSRDYEDFEIEITIKSTNCPHNNVTNNVGRRAATCTEEGYTGDTVCDDCHCTVSYGRTIAVAAHNRVVKGCIDATCTSEGYSGDVYCKDCGIFIMKGEVTEKLSHIEGEPVIDVAATYTSEGKCSYYCKNCHTFIRSEVTPKLSLDEHEHVWVSQYYCDEHNHWQECAECHNLSDKEAHRFDDGDYITATCTTEGEVRYVCAVCGMTIVKTEVPGHRPVWRYDESGDKHYKQCKICGEVFETQEHSYGHWVETVAPTDAELGTYVRSCTQCGYIETTHSATNPDIASDIGGGNGGQTSGDGSQTGSNTGKGENPDTGIEFDVMKFVALALVSGATILLQRKCKI